MKKIVLTLIVPIIFLTAGIAMSNSSKEITKKVGLRVQGDNITAEVRINDLPLCNITPKDSSCVRGISSYLTGEKNKIEIVSSTDKGKIWARLYEISSSETTMVFSTDAYKDEDIEGQILKVNKLNKEVDFTSLVKGLDWEWKNNKVLNSNDEKEAIAFTKHIYTTLQKGEIDSILSTFEPLFINETQVINNSGMAGDDIEKNALKDELKTDVNLIVKDKDPVWQWDDFDSVELVLIKIADGRLYDLRRKDGSPFIRTSQKGEFGRFTMSNKIGKRKGQWFFFLN